LWQIQNVLDQLITSLAAFSGLVMESMTRGYGWLFLDMERRVERGMLQISMLRTTLAQQRPVVVQDSLLNPCSKPAKT